jgi:hypothetical protein
VFQEITMPEGAYKFSKRRMVWSVVALIALFGLWYAFRPEKLFINKRVDEAPPATVSRLTPLFTGSFQSDARETSGRATVYQQPNGGRILTLSNFSTSNAPGLQVILLDGSNLDHNRHLSLDNSDRDLGGLKATQGEQSYALPADVDFNRLNTVAVYSADLKSIRGTATLDPF